MPAPAPRGVLCAGNLVYDILVRPVDALVWDTTVWVDSIETNLGGNGASTSYALATLGVPVCLAGMTGSDSFGDYQLARLAGAGVDVRGIHRCDAGTATSIAIVDSAGRRTFLHRPGASQVAFSEPLQLTAALVEGVSHFHLANPYALPNMRRHAAEMLRRARAAGLTTSVDTGWDARGEWMNVLAPCLPYTDLLFANQDEALRLSGSGSFPEAARRLRGEGARDVVIKLGGAGCAVFTSAAEIASPAFEVEVVDTTGAGDCFVAGFLAALHRGGDYQDAARFANAVGALSVQRLGATTGLLTYEATRAWMGRVPG